MSGPNLSEYFRNDGPSMFDEIVPSPTTAAAPTGNPFDDLNQIFLKILNNVRWNLSGILAQNVYYLFVKVHQWQLSI